MAEPVDARLLAEMLDRHGAALALFAAQWTTAADDCVQEALVELARQPEAPTNPAAWLYRTVRNRALNASRAARRRTAHEQAAPAPRGAAQRSAGGAEQVELADLLAALDDAQRETVVLRVWGQLTWDEIAAIVGGSKSAAQRRYVHSLEHLRRLWESPSCPKT
ncbi:MAG TPA: sigma-70 family RNA polymerase sigma factor [Lacipirellulaceae bacterium]|nr:sigma-70 family RNA polymerase sigma factor [Lacipirellulaceae bacterium]